MPESIFKRLSETDLIRLRDILADAYPHLAAVYDMALSSLTAERKALELTKIREDALRKIAAMDYANAAVNGCGYNAVMTARIALALTPSAPVERSNSQFHARHRNGSVVHFQNERKGEERRKGGNPARGTPYRRSGLDRRTSGESAREDQSTLKG